MRVQCYLCEHEEDGFCFKKKRNGKPIRIKTKKRRSCASYSEEAVRVLTDYRKKERHRATLRNLEMRRIRTENAIRDLQKKGLESLKGRAKISGEE